MIELETIQRIWSLIPPPAADGSIEVRELETVVTPYGHPLLTIDGLGNRHLLIPASIDTKLIEDKRSSGVHLLGSNWGEGEEQRRFIDLTCLKPHLNGVFDLIIYDVISELLKLSESPDRVCLVVLNRWREMLSRDSAPILDRSIMTGIYGELIVLRELTRTNVLAIDVWTGPNKGRFDFFAGDRALEVKTSFRRQGILLSIHGHDQLDPPLGGSLHVVVILLEETPTGGESLNDIVNSIVAMGVNRSDIYVKLVRLGLSPEMLETMADQRFSVVEQRIYAVTLEFPRITASSFASGELPRGVVALSYQIDLSVPPPFPLKTDQASAVLAAFLEGIM